MQDFRKSNGAQKIMHFNFYFNDLKLLFSFNEQENLKSLLQAADVLTLQNATSLVK